MKNPRINVTLNADDVKVMKILCKKKQMTMSSLVKKMIHEWLDDYEDMLLAKRADEIEDQWEKSGRKTISHEELWKRLNT